MLGPFLLLSLIKFLLEQFGFLFKIGRDIVSLALNNSLFLIDISQLFEFFFRSKEILRQDLFLVFLALFPVFPLPQIRINLPARYAEVVFVALNTRSLELSE